MSRGTEITTLKVGSTIFSTALARLLEGTPIWPNVGLDACKIIVSARAGKLADMSEVLLAPGVMKPGAPSSSQPSFARNRAKAPVQSSASIDLPTS
jgi:hypothetical protein